MTVDLRGLLRSSITSPDAPPGITSWDVLPSLTSRRSRPRLLPKAALRPRMLLRALRPGVILASLASADVPRRLASDLEVVFHPREAGLASPDALPGTTSWDVLPSLTSRRSRPRLLPKPAMRPETLFKDCIYDDIIDSRVSNLRVSSCVGGC